MIDLDSEPLPHDIVEIIPLALREQHGVVPIRADGPKLVVAMVDPSNFSLIDEQRFVTQRDVEGVAASAASIRKALDRSAPVRDLALFFDAVSISNPSSIANATTALFYRSIWAGARFINIDKSGIALWLENGWKLETRLTDHARNALLQRIRLLATWAGRELGAMRMTVARGHFGFLFQLRRDERGEPDLLVEQLEAADFEARLQADRIIPELPEASPYR